MSILTKRVTITQAWNGEADCLNCSLRSSALFNGLTVDDFEQVHHQIEQDVLKPGDTLYKTGDNGQHLFTVRSGLLKLVHYLPDGTQRIVRLAQSTDVLGLEVLVTDRYQHEAIVLRTTEMCRYPAAAVTQLSHSNSILHRDLMSRWQRALDQAEASLTQFSTGTAKRRMANLLLYLSEANDSAECVLLGREDIGSLLSITIETASRTISEFKRMGIITEIRHNHFHLDKPAVEAVAAR